MFVIYTLQYDARYTQRQSSLKLYLSNMAIRFKTLHSQLLVLDITAYNKFEFRGEKRRCGLSPDVMASKSCTGLHTQSLPRAAWAVHTVST